MTTFQIRQPVKDKNITEMWLEAHEQVIWVRIKLKGFDGVNTVAVISEEGIRLTPFSAGFGIAVDDKYCMKVVT